MQNIFSWNWFTALNFSGSFEKHLSKNHKKNYFFSEVRKKPDYAVRGVGGGLRKLRTGPQLIGFSLSPSLMPHFIFIITYNTF